MSDQKTVLIVDDESSLRRLMRASLGGGTCRVVEAQSGTEALAQVERERPDLILLDVGMPGLDGYDVCRALKNDPATADITVVMLTALTQEADRERGIQAGADGYITKPFSPVDLVTTVNQLLDS